MQVKINSLSKEKEIFNIQVRTNNSLYRILQIQIKKHAESWNVCNFLICVIFFVYLSTVITGETSKRKIIKLQYLKQFALAVFERV